MVETIAKVRDKIDRGKAIVGVGVDNTTMEKLCSRENCDLVMFYPTSVYHEAENPFLAGYMPIGNSNIRMIEIAKEITTVVSGHHLFIGVNGSDPFLNKELLLKRLQDVHFNCIHNYPAMGLVDGYFKANLDRASLGFDKEVDLFRYASSAGFHCCAMVSTQRQAVMMAKAGADIIIFYLGLGDMLLSAEANILALEKDIKNLNEYSESLERVGSKAILLFHSEHVRTMDDVKYILENAKGIHGYYLLPVAKKEYPFKTLHEEIRQLRET